MNDAAKNMSDAGANAAGHTPGPWTVDTWTGALGTADGVHNAVWRDDDELICTTGLRGSEESLPNAHLIAAAPDLLAALRALTEHFAAVMGGPLVAGKGVQFANGVEGIPTIARARAAIAKALGNG